MRQWHSALPISHYLTFALRSVCVGYNNVYISLDAGLTKVPIDGQPKSIVKDLEDMARTYIKVNQPTDSYLRNSHITSLSIGCAAAYVAHRSFFSCLAQPCPR